MHHLNDLILAEVLDRAVEQASRSPCAKSKRGVVVFKVVQGRLSFFAAAHNAPPGRHVCSADERCRAACGKICVHAEQRALLDLGTAAKGADMLHVKVIDAKPVPSGPPSCWQCSKLVLEAQIRHFYLLHETEGGVAWRRYTADEFHAATLARNDLPSLMRSR